jgi:hypothetical protein
MGRDHDAGQFEWVNAWAETKATVPVAPTVQQATDVFSDVARDADAFAQAPNAEAIAPQPLIAPVASTMADDQLMRDIAEIERVRDALAAMPLSSSAKRRTQAFTLVPSRTSDPVPVVIGGVLALVMLTVFGAAAAMTKLAR